MVRQGLQHRVGARATQLRDGAGAGGDPHHPRSRLESGVDIGRGVTHDHRGSAGEAGLVASGCPGPRDVDQDRTTDDRAAGRSTGASSRSRLARVDLERSRPTVLTVMAEHGDIDPVWDRPFGTGEPVDLAALGVSAGLVRQLRGWNDEFGRLALGGSHWPSPHAEQEWRRVGLDLAFHLQDELWDIEVRYWDGGPQQTYPVRERRRRSPPLKIAKARCTHTAGPLGRCPQDTH